VGVVAAGLARRRVLPGGERHDLDAWVLATAPRALAYALSLLGDRERAEDIVQDCYCRLLGKADRYDLPRDGLKILLKAITNASINQVTRERHHFRLDGDNGQGDGGRLQVADRPWLQPAPLLMHRELEQAVQAGLAKLPLPQRAALELKSLGHSQQEIAELLDISPNYAGVLVHRARQAMAAFLAPYMQETAE
jgi:RNA polymerase sigma-70 factor (ECF subfamily)